MWTSDGLRLRRRFPGRVGGRQHRHFSVRWPAASPDDEIPAQIQHDGAGEELRWGLGRGRLGEALEDLTLGFLHLLRRRGPEPSRSLTGVADAPAAVSPGDESPSVAPFTMGTKRKEQLMRQIPVRAVWLDPIDVLVPSHGFQHSEVPAVKGAGLLALRAQRFQGRAGRTRAAASMAPHGVRHGKPFRGEHPSHSRMVPIRRSAGIATVRLRRWRQGYGLAGGSWSRGSHRHSACWPPGRRWPGYCLNLHRGCDIDPESRAARDDESRAAGRDLDGLAGWVRCAARQVGKSPRRYKLGLGGFPVNSQWQWSRISVRQGANQEEPGAIVPEEGGLLEFDCEIPGLIGGQRCGESLLPVEPVGDIPSTGTRRHPPDVRRAARATVAAILNASSTVRPRGLQAVRIAKPGPRPREASR